jgi:hypothetical protein
MQDCLIENEVKMCLMPFDWQMHTYYYIGIMRIIIIYHEILISLTY